MIKEGFKWLIGDERFIIVPLSYILPNGENESFDIKNIMGSDLGYRGLSIFNRQKNIIRVIEESHIYYNTLGNCKANSVLILWDGEVINPAYGILTSSNRIDFYTNKTNHHREGDFIHVYGKESLNYLFSTHITYSQQSYLRFTPPSGINLTPNFGQSVKIVNAQGYPVGFYPFRGYDLSLFANDSYSPIIEYYIPYV